MWKYVSGLIMVSLMGVSAAQAGEFTCWDGSLVSDKAFCPPELIVCPPGPEYKDVTIDVTGLMNEPVPVYITYVAYGPGGPVQMKGFQIQYPASPQKNYFISYMYGSLHDQTMILNDDGETMRFEDNGSYLAKEEPDGFVVTAEEGNREAFYACLLDTFQTYLKSSDRTAELHVTCGKLEYAG